MKELGFFCSLAVRDILAVHGFAQAEDERPETTLKILFLQVNESSSGFNALFIPSLDPP